MSRRWRVRLALAIGLLVTTFLIWQFIPGTESAALPENAELCTAVWMGVTWSMDAHTDDDLNMLAADLLAHGVDDAYIYVSYLRADDSFNPTYNYAENFLSRMRELAPAIRWLAWVGVPISITKPDGAFVNNRLDDADIRVQIAEFAAGTVSEMGFNGVHLNAELIPNDDPSFLTTLEMIRETLPEAAFFSITAHALRPSEAVTSIPYPPVPHHWRPEYLYEVASRVDQVALMAYDSGLPFPRDYQNWVAYQTRVSAAALATLDTELYIGLPTSEEWTISHQTQAETLANALYGFRQAYDPRITGIALYPFWETTPDEWSLMPDVGCSGFS